MADPKSALGAGDETIDATRHETLSAGDAAPLRQRLRVVFPVELSGCFELGPDRLVLGRAPEEPGSPPLSHPTVSRRHFAIEWDPVLGTYLGSDLGSRNGAWIDGTPVNGAWHAIGTGSIIRLGSIVMVVEAGHGFEHPDAADVSRRAVPGDSLAVRRLRQQIARAAPDVSPALIVGETGTGKELIAREVHRLSGRKGEFVAVNCATFGEQLIESQLFGHVKGAFTGATSDQAGLFLAAQGGTLFLDEIGEMPMELQPKLLRAIQEREIRAVGSTKTERVDVRVVAATHRDLAAKARAGDFRQDLYGRLALWEIQVPSLRERRTDVLSWISHLHAVWLAERKLEATEALSFNAEAVEALVLSPWPENLRGLNRLVHEVAAKKGAEPLRKDQLPAWVLKVA
ncbi:MAG: sigma-54-dependent Fis family transcriptional regulator [Deltaproteobacteria bacterium]|nr:sigma-54-dependent Fis family transcriptional regulator [Deltaproteobacteria bacterium]